MTGRAVDAVRTVVVTGGGSGIGRAVARRFADQGAQVLIAGRRAAALRETAAAHPRIHPLAVDITEPDGPARIAAAAERFGAVDVLVNNAAITVPAELGAIDADAAARQVATNLLAPVAVTQEVLPALEAARGVIVNVTSNPAERGWPRNSVYGATKVALDHLTRTWAVELAPRGVRVVSVAPGPTETEVFANSGMDPQEVAVRWREGLRRIPLGRRADPAEIAWWICRMAAPEARHITGTVLRVDGGVTVT